MRGRHLTGRLIVVALCGLIISCAGANVRPVASPSKLRTDALLVLPGFGYGRGGERALRSLAPSMAADGIDLYVPAYISRSGLAASRTKLQRFIRDHHLDRYQHVHVFAFIAGAWTFNPLADGGALPNLATVVYDRSPFQERAPRVAADKLHFLTWLRYGSPVFDVARTPYAPLTNQGVKVALLVETAPTPFIRRYEKTVRSYGPFDFTCDGFRQRYEDCVYLPMNHQELYTRFAEVWPEVRAFIRTGRFTPAANRTPPAGDPLSSTGRQNRTRQR